MDQDPGIRAREDISFGQIAIEKKFVTGEQVKEAIETQKKLEAMGEGAKKLGEILLEKNYLSKEEADEVLKTQNQLEQRRQIAGYEILAKLGQGGMGAVYKARQRSMERIVALKILPPKFAKNPDFIERFVREARAVAKLNHENIIAGIDVGESNGLYYFAMEYADGQTVYERIRQSGPIAEDEAIDITLQIARALEHAHRHDLVHRDVKPQNIIITKKGIAKLCDLGLAKTEDSEASVTQRGVSVGTPHYISPEQAKGEVDVDIRSDIYSLGASFYHMVVGEVPFVGSGPMVVMTKHLTETPAYPRSRNPDVSKTVSDVIMRMMAKYKEGRYQTPTQLIKDFMRLQDGKAPSRKPKSSRMRVQRPGSGIPQAQRSKPISNRQQVAVVTATPVRPKSERRRRPSTSRHARPGRRGGGRGGRRDDDRRDRAYMARPKGPPTTEIVLIVGAIVLLLILIGFFLYAGLNPEGGSPVDHESGRQERRQDMKNIEAGELLEKAKAFENLEEFEYPEQIIRYQEVIRKYPGTPQAREAQACIARVKKKEAREW
ncbi:MAG: serine/threonine protein kinase [Planctomycetota bacterium]|jgi:serine/threonine-protein kinase